MNQIVDKIIRCNINDLDIINFPINEKFGLVITSKKGTFNFVININPNSDKLLVLASKSIPNIEYGSPIENPIFDRILWPFPISTLYFTDSTIINENNSTLGNWGLGTTENWHIEEISKIIKIITNKLFNYTSFETPYDNLIIYGEEMGSFMALQLSILLKNSIVLAEKPHFNICNIQNWPILKNQLFNDLSDDEIYERYSYKLNIYDLIIKEKYVPNTYLILDYGNKYEVKTQYEEFFSKITNLPFLRDELFDKFNIIIDKKNKEQNALKYTELYELIEKICLLMDIKYNNQKTLGYYDYSRVQLRHKTQLLKYITCRVDVKNFGVNNSIEFISSSDESLFKLSPNWFNTIEGKGMIFESVTGNLDLNLRCINDGLLKIFLRSKYYNETATKKMIPIYLNYHKLSLNGEDIINKDKIIWHNKPFIFEKNVKDGDEIKIHVEWSPI